MECPVHIVGCCLSEVSGARAVNCKHVSLTLEQGASVLLSVTRQWGNCVGTARAPLKGGKGVQPPSPQRC